MAMFAAVCVTKKCLHPSFLHKLLHDKNVPRGLQRPENSRDDLTQIDTASSNHQPRSKSRAMQPFNH